MSLNFQFNFNNNTKLHLTKTSKPFFLKCSSDKRYDPQRRKGGLKDVLRFYEAESCWHLLASRCWQTLKSLKDNVHSAQLSSDHCERNGLTIWKAFKSKMLKEKNNENVFYGYQNCLVKRLII